MNVIELAKEAGFSITTDWMGRPTMVSIGTNGDVGLKGTQELERFANLVRAEAVEECLEVVRSFRLRMDASNENIVVGIKQHFGVD